VTSLHGLLATSGVECSRGFGLAMAIEVGAGLLMILNWLLGIALT
jgi:hypothetical protein